MARVTDPVCGMTVDTDTAAAKAQYKGQPYYFCSEQCAATFRANPERYARANAGSDASGTLERHEPPFTRDGMIAPKFGSAGSGGAEYEPGPERHGRS